MKRILFIINRQSGTRRRKELEHLAARHLDPARFSYKTAFTEYRGHAVELAREAAQKGTEIVAAVGGDGSVNEVASGILGSGAILAVIPAGSGNGLARALGIPRHPGRAVALINKLRMRSIDVGKANEHIFLSNAGVGFDALVAHLFTDNKGRGLINYGRVVMGAFRTYRPEHYHLTTDAGTLQQEAFFITAANSNQFGYNFRIAPHAQPDDGWLDLCIMRPLRLRNLPLVSLQALVGILPQSRYAHHLRSRSLLITCREGMEWMQVDGDAVPVKDNKIMITLLPKAIKVICQ